MDPLTKAYMQIINESDEGTVKTNLKVGAAFGDKDNEKNASNFIKGSGPDDVDDLECPDEAPAELGDPRHRLGEVHAPEHPGQAHDGQGDDRGEAQAHGQSVRGRKSCKPITSLARR